MMKQIGSEAEARLALDIHRLSEEAFKEFELHPMTQYGADGEDAGRYNEYDGYGETIQYSVDDWVQLGRGCSRAAWLSPSGVTYKVPTARVDWANTDEWANYRRYPSHFRRGRCRIPYMTLYTPGGTPVLAVETIKGRPHWKLSEDEALGRFIEKINMYDAHPWNILINEKGERVVVDFA